jgi:hypothetical protein
MEEQQWSALTASRQMAKRISYTDAHVAIAGNHAKTPRHTDAKMAAAAAEAEVSN